MKRRPAHRAAAALLAVLAGSAGSRAGEPLWSDVPRKVDPAAQAYERLAQKPAEPFPEDLYPIRLSRTSPFHVSDSISFAQDGKRFRIAHLEAVEASRICADAAGARWACGLRARLALTKLLGGGTLLCRAVAEQTDPLAVECLRAHADLGALIALDGNAVAAAGDAHYAAEADKARQDGAGIWASAAP